MTHLDANSPDEADILFPTLEAAVFRNQTAGFHNTHKITLYGSHALDNAVVLHEMVHDRFIRHTSDGQSLLFFRELSKADGLTSNDRANANRLFETCIERGRFAHEVAATYLGIKHLRTHEVASAMASLPRAYLEYYNTLGAIIDDVIPCPHVQASIAAAILEYAFSSELLMQVAECERLDHIAINEYTDPTARLRAILHMCSTDFLSSNIVHCQNLLNDVALRHHVAPWRVDDSSSWASNPMVGFEVDRLICKSYRRIIENAVGLPSLCDDSHDRWFRNAALRWGSLIEITLPEDLSDSLLSFSRSHALRPMLEGAWSASNSVIDLRNRCKPVDIGLPHVTALMKRTSYACIDFVAESGTAPDRQYLAHCWDNLHRRGSPRTARCTFDDITHIFKDRMTTNRFTGKITFTCGMNPDNHANSVFQRLVESLTFHHDGSVYHTPDSNDVYIYVHGHWLDWVDSAFINKQTPFYDICSVRRDGLVELPLSLNLDVHFVCLPSSPFKFFRAFPRSITLFINALLATPFETGDLRRFSPDDLVSLLGTTDSIELPYRLSQAMDQWAFV